MSRNRLGAVWLTAIGYPTLMAALWLSTEHSYADAHLIMRDRWWFIAGIAAVTLMIAKVSGTRINHSRRIGAMSWLLIISVAVIVAGGLQAILEPGTDNRVVLLTVLGTLFVGIGEETAYRGIVFNRLAQRMSVTKTVVVSSVLFGLMHVVNVLVQDAHHTFSQLLFTTFFGSAFGWVYVSSRGNLRLVIVLHWLYDAFLLAPNATAAGGNPNTGAGLLLVAAAIILNIHGFIRYRKRMWSDVLAA